MHKKAAHEKIMDEWFMGWNKFPGKEMFKCIAFKQIIVNKMMETYPITAVWCGLVAVWPIKFVQSFVVHWMSIAGCYLVYW